MKPSIHFKSDHEFEDECSFVLNGTEDEYLVIEIVQEQAVDSYNAIFDNDITLTRRQVVELQDWLAYHIGIERSKK